jgi:hypothetical protein
VPGAALRGHRHHGVIRCDLVTLRARRYELAVHFREPAELAVREFGLALGFQVRAEGETGDRTPLREEQS